MEVQYINPFIESVSDLFKTMIGCEATLDNVKKTEPTVRNSELVSMICLSGVVHGTVALIFPVPTALALVSRFVGMEAKEADEMVTDAVAELVNIVAGGAKARMNNNSGVITLSIPNIIKTRGGTMLSPSWTTWIEVSFSSDLGPFNLRVTFEK